MVNNELSAEELKLIPLGNITEAVKAYLYTDEDTNENWIIWHNGPPDLSNNFSEEAIAGHNKVITAEAEAFGFKPTTKIVDLPANFKFVNDAAVLSPFMLSNMIRGYSPFVTAMKWKN